MNGRPDAMGMRYAASQLRGKADRIALVAGRLGTQVESMTFAGPAADQFRAAMRSDGAQLRAVARILAEAADALSQAATRVEADPTGFYGSGATS